MKLILFFQMYSNTHLLIHVVEQLLSIAYSRRTRL